MNTFVDTFDADQGQKNKITFKAVASNLEWNNKEIVEKFKQHCKSLEIQNSEQVMDFLYEQYNNDENKFEQILEKMN